MASKSKTCYKHLCIIESDEVAFLGLTSDKELSFLRKTEKLFHNSPKRDGI